MRSKGRGQGAQMDVAQCALLGAAARCGLILAAGAAVLLARQTGVHARQMRGPGELDPATRSLCSQRGGGELALCTYCTR